VDKKIRREMLTKKLIISTKELKGCIFTVSLNEISDFNENVVPKAVSSVFG
jgi:hypothetical protein